MNIQSKALGQALLILQSIGATYAVIFAGEKHGTLDVVTANPPKDGPRRQPVKYRWADIYTPWVNTARPGSTFEHVCESREAAESLRASVSSVMAKQFGAGGGMTTVTPRADGKFTVEALLITISKTPLVEAGQ